MKEKYICYYTNSNGYQKFKVFDDVNEGLEFCRTLDKRIEKGTCSGYEFTRLPKGV